MIPVRLKLTEMNALLMLGIDTSGKTATVAAADENTVYAQFTVLTKLTHSQIILPMVSRTLEGAGLSLENIEAVATANGPGSYTGLRIGVSSVKAMAYALGIGCVGVSTLEALAANLKIFSGIICPVMTARQELVYNALFSSDGRTVTRLTEDRVISSAELSAQLDAYADMPVILNGDGSAAFSQKYDKGILAPPSLRMQLATGIIDAAQGKPLITPDKLSAAYLQQVKAEKDLQDKLSAQENS